VTNVDPGGSAIAEPPPQIEELIGVVRKIADLIKEQAKDLGRSKRLGLAPGRSAVAGVGAAVRKVTAEGSEISRAENTSLGRRTAARGRLMMHENKVAYQIR
jgi:hypothetical protein